MLAIAVATTLVKVAVISANSDRIVELRVPTVAASSAMVSELCGMNLIGEEQ